MTTILIITIVCLALLVFILIVLCINNSKKANEYKTNYDKSRDTCDLLKDKLQSATEENGKLRESLQGNAHSNSIEDNINKLKAEQSDLEGSTAILADEVRGLALVKYLCLQEIASSREAQLQVENVTHGLEDRNRELFAQSGDLERNIKSLVKELQRLVKISKIVDENKDNVIWEPILTEKQAKLRKIIRDLILLYPDLEIDFANIEWKKIWMPQLQQLGSTIDGKQGVYRLILKKLPMFRALRDNEEIELPVCYVGQASNFKDRWYQHVKKMIGVTPKGQERLYEWQPDDFQWCIVEEGKDIDLDASEKYWIDYYGAKDGLNKKSGNN